MGLIIKALVTLGHSDLLDNSNGEISNLGMLVTLGQSSIGQY
jgi:hypothetical protein